MKAAALTRTLSRKREREQSIPSPCEEREQLSPFGHGEPFIPFPVRGED